MEIISTAVRAFASILPALFQVAICIYYFNNRRATDSTLLLVGSLIHLLTAIATGAVMPSLLQERLSSGAMRPIDIGFVYGALSLFGFVGTVCSIIGLYLLVRRVVESGKKPSDGFEEY